jgi:hypothetical protein
VPATTLETWRRLPAEAPEHLVRVAHDASARLRHDRRRELPVSVEVTTANGTLLFQKLRRRGSELVAAFAFRDPGGDRLEGALLLEGGAEVLRLEAPVGAARPLVARAWAAALVIYADLTCADIAPPEPRATPRRTGRAAPGAGRTGTRSVRRGAAASDAPALGRVHSIAEAIERLQSVAGYVRRLPSGHTPSSEQLAAAAAVGIRVPPGCTWVRPHVRSSEVLRISIGSRRLW